MTNTLHERIQQRLKDLEMTPEAASLAAGLDRGYIGKTLGRPSSSPRSDTLKKLARALKTTEAWLLSEGDAPPPGADVIEAEPSIRNTNAAGLESSAPLLPARQDMPLDIPVYGTAAGSLMRGAFQFEGGIVDHVRRPPALMGAREVYALYVEGTSMEPQYFPGDLIYIHPRRPPKVGDIVVVQSQNGEHAAIEASLGIYRRVTEKSVTIGKRNPDSEVDLNRAHVRSIHRVLTVNELFGV
jgi:phage repressor protein C with HTH and peptisase S24 domain